MRNDGKKGLADEGGTTAESKKDLGSITIDGNNVLVGNDVLVAVCKDEAPIVDLGEFKFTESRYVRGTRGWMASSLYKQAEKEGAKPFDVPLASFDLSPLHFKVGCTDDFIWHMKRCMDCDTDIPILLDNLGQIADGNHRVCKAIIEGKRYIKALRLKDMPPYDYLEEEDNNN